jgi:hypothetical protein
MSGFAGESAVRELPDPETLAERLLDAAAAGSFEQALANACASVEAGQDSLDPLELFRYRLLFFDIGVVSTTDSGIHGETAEALLAAAIEAGSPAWEAIRASNRFNEIERLAVESDTGIDMLELLAYSPDPGMRGFAISQIESAAMRALGNRGDSRGYERLLHAIGASEDAYRLEMTRKQRTPDSLVDQLGMALKPDLPRYRLVAIAGGHAQLRGTAASLLRRRGGETVQIPSSLEAVRRERDIVHLLRGCDLAMLLVRQITHSTSDQVRKAAEKLDVPVVYSNALSAVAIERQLFDAGR